jgi:hypothetical protein
VDFWPKTVRQYVLESGNSWFILPILDWMGDTEYGNSRWVKQWTPHGAWYQCAGSVRARR